MNTEILKSLSFQQMFDRRENIEPHHTRTCQWVLESDEYESWSSRTHSLLWIKGKPVSGKSTLMAFPHEELEASLNESDVIQLEFFFSARGAELQHTPRGMFRSLLHQLFKKDEGTRKYMRSAYRKRYDTFGHTEQDWDSPLFLLDLFTRSLLTSSTLRKVSIFIDALDEAGAESGQELAEYFHRLIDRAQGAMVSMKICISCRHYPIAISHSAIQVTVEDHNSEDLAMYIEENLHLSMANDSSGQGTWEDLANQLIQRANGIFQWARLMLPLVTRRVQEGESIGHIHSWLSQVPAGLEDTYTYIFNHVIEAKNKGTSFLLFQWVCLAERPLTLEEIRYALVAHDIEFPDFFDGWEKIEGFIEYNRPLRLRIQALSGVLVEVVTSANGDSIIQVMHQSVNDFLLKDGLLLLSNTTQVLSPHTNSDNILVQCQSTLYRSCLIYLHLSMQEMSQTIFSNFNKEKELMLKHTFPLLTYATCNILIHGEKAAEHRASAVQNELEMLCALFDNWAHMYRLLNSKDTESLHVPNGVKLLHIAALANLVDLIEPLLLSGGHVSDRDDDGNTALHMAARYGHLTAIEKLVELEADYEMINKSMTSARGYVWKGGRTPLVEAADRGHIECVKWLLNKGASVENLNGGGGGALQLASFQCSRPLVRILLRAGANVNAQGGGGSYHNALQAAVFRENLDIARLLLESGADVNTQCGQYGTALQIACYRGSAEMVQMLLDFDADVNAQCGMYGNALNAAIFSRSIGIVKLLVAAYANVNAQCPQCMPGQYCTALQTACHCGSSEIVQILLNSNADVDSYCDEFGTALKVACYLKKTDIVGILLNKGADVNTQCGQYGTALQIACYRGSAEIVQMLLDFNADVNAQCGPHGAAIQRFSYDTGWVRSGIYYEMSLGFTVNLYNQCGPYNTALQNACCSGNAEAVAKLLKSHAILRPQHGEFSTALQIACHRGHAEIVQMFLGLNADGNAQCGRYGTALIAAVYGAHSTIASLLLDAGADPLLGNELQQTPLHLAISQHDIHDTMSSLASRLYLAINSRDLASQTPLNLSVALGHVDFALKLLSLGANPCIQDDYGRNILDWALEHDSMDLVKDIRKRYPDILLSSDGFQRSNTRQSVLRICDVISQAAPSAQWSLLQHLNRELQFLGDIENSRYLQKLQPLLFDEKLDDLNKVPPTCITCRMIITKTFFVCHTCGGVDLCPFCMKRLQKRPWHIQLDLEEEHQIFEREHTHEDEGQLVGSASENLHRFLDDLRRQFSPQDAPELHLDPSDNPSSEVESRSPVRLFSSVLYLSIIIFVLVFVALAGMLIFWLQVKL